MQTKPSICVRHRGPSVARCAVLLLLITFAAMLGACSTGGGGGNGEPDPPNPFGLNFTYPFNGQEDVPLDTQMVVVFPNAVQGDAEGALRLQMGRGADQPTTPITVVQDDNQPNILRLVPDQDLAPNSNYRVVANRRVTDGDTFINEDVGLFSFSTRPAKGRPAAGGFEVVQTTPGNTNPVTGTTLPFTTFNALRVRFSEPVDPDTVIPGETFSFTGPDGDAVTGRLTVRGRNLTFDPTDDLTPGTYTLDIASGVTSAFGNSLAAFNADKTVTDAGDTVTENLTVMPTSTDAADIPDIPDNPVNGLTSNLVNISSPLVGSNDILTYAAPNRLGVKGTLAQVDLPEFRGLLPGVVRAGQKALLTGLTVRFNGDIRSPIRTGPANIFFANDADLYIMANSLRNVPAPTAVQLRVDLGIGTLIQAMKGRNADFIREAQANGVLDQTVLNIQAAGIAVPQDSGDLRLSAVGTFDIRVNRNTTATVDLGLTFVLPVADQVAVQRDDRRPYPIAQYPSACLYLFGTPAYNDLFEQFEQFPPNSLPEQICANDGGATINSLPIESSPAITFSEPIDASSVSDQSVQLTGAAGDVPVKLRAEGSTIVVDPEQPLAPDTTYTIHLASNAPITDLSGNEAVFDNPVGPGQTITFTTEPQTLAGGGNPTPPLLSTLTPGIPCALDGGDFQTGGDIAGNCAGDAGNGTFPELAVFESPANVDVDAFFTKFVQADSIVLADGCLTNGSGNTVANATVAVQQMDGSGQCAGVVPGEIAFGNRGDALTRSFTFRPVNDLVPGQRYWIVICGTEGSSCSNQIVDAGGRPLNTTPISGTGSTQTADAAAGGPDLIQPFDAIASSTDYFANAFTLPKTDTNGNGQFDDGERAQPGTRALATLSAGGVDLGGEQPDGLFATYASGTRPLALRGGTITDCSFLGNITADDGTPAVGDIPGQCLRGSLLVGGFNFLTSINAGVTAITGALEQALKDIDDPDETALADIPLLGPVLEPVENILGGLLGNGDDDGLTFVLGDLVGNVNGVVDGLLEGLGLDGITNPLQTGRVVLRFPTAADSDGNDTGMTQSGFIVEQCTGTLAGEEYNFQPCFVGALTLVANAPDGQGVAVEQQTATANVVGPVSFQQNGRLVIDATNVNSVALEAQALGLLPATASIAPGDLTLQLATSATHGGRAFPSL